MSDSNNKRSPMEDRRRDHRIDVGLPFLMTDEDGSARWHCKTIDISPTGILFEVDEDNAPALGKIVNVVIQGPAESGWEHINKRPMRVVRVQEHRRGLVYADLDTSKLAEGPA